MKKFVGLVNGKSFDNEKDWTKAAQEAIKNNDGNLAISSYYKYTNEADEKKEDTKDDDKYVSTNEYFLGNRKPDKVEKLDSSMVGFSGYTNVEYTVSPELEERLKVASNKNNIRESINYHVTKLANNIKSYKEDLRETEKKIEDLQKKLYEQQALLLDQEGRRKYYNRLLDIVETPDPEEPADDCSGKNKKEYVAPKVLDTKDRIKELLNIDENTSLFDVLRQLGILK